MSTSFSGLTNQDTISDQALFCITNKDGKSRNVTWATLKENLTLEQLVTSINNGSVQSVGRIDVVNDTYSIASNSGGILSFDFANIPNHRDKDLKHYRYDPAGSHLSLFMDSLSFKFGYLPGKNLLCGFNQRSGLKYGHK